jgi:hypothetical protein
MGDILPYDIDHKCGWRSGASSICPVMMTESAENHCQVWLWHRRAPLPAGGSIVNLSVPKPGPDRIRVDNFAIDVSPDIARDHHRKL